jgi:hypothetical protein
VPTSKSTLAHQQRSLLNAENWGQPWMPHEVELLLEPAPATELAELLRRTVFAVQSARHLLAQGVALGGGHGAHRAREVKVCPCHGLQVLPTGGCALD